MARDPSALLVIDIGTLYTHVVLLDQVAGEYRAVARGEALSTLEPPVADAWQGTLAAIREIEQITGQPIARDETPIMPQRADGSGIDAIVVVSSAAGTLPIVLAAISNDTTAASLRRVARSTYTTILGSVTLDEQDDPELGEGESWIDYQLAKLAKLPASTVLIAGGIEGGNAAPLERLAHMLAFTVLRNEQSSGSEFAHVIFAGNSSAYSGVESALSTIVPITPTANVRPTLENEQLTPARLELARLYTDRMLSNLPGAARLRSMSSNSFRATTDGYFPLIRFLSQHHQRQVLVVDVGSMTTVCYASDGGVVNVGLETNCGTAYGAGGVLDRVGPQAISRWVPFEMTDQAIREHILNKLLRPQIIPITHEDMLIEHAIAREALKCAMLCLRDERPNLTYDLIIAGGGVLTHVAHPSEALLMLLDVLQPDSTNTLLLTDVYIDWDGLLPICAATIWQHQDATFCLLEQDALRNGPLASCIVPGGSGKPGELAVEAELTPVGGTPITIQVLHGEVRRLPLPVGRRGTLRLRPARGVRIGANEPGAEVQSDIAAIHGSTLGVVIDARGRPLPLAADDNTRRSQIWAWLAQLGAVGTSNPYQAAPVSSTLTEIPAAPAPSFEPAPTSDLPDRPNPEMPDWLRADMENEGLAQPSPEEFGVEALPPWLVEDGSPAATDTVVDLGERGPSARPEDFSALRAELTKEKPKRGLFGRKK
jgi:hypothetical protein